MQVMKASAGTLLGANVRCDGKIAPSLFHAGGVMARAADGYRNCVRFVANVRVLSESVTVRVGYSPAIYAHGALYRVTVTEIRTASAASGGVGTVVERATPGADFVARFAVLPGSVAFVLPHPSPLCRFLAYEKGVPALMGTVIAIECD